MIDPIIDISHWQGDIDASKAISSGIHGVYMKAGGIYQNNNNFYTDSKFDLNYKKFRGRIPVGFYWWFEPHYSGVEQAKYFYSLFFDKKYQLPPVVDVESNYQEIYPSLYSYRLREFVEILTIMCGGIRPAIYTRGEFWNRTLEKSTWASRYKLWIAYYTDHDTDPFRYPAYVPYPWRNVGWWLWQYSEKGDGPKYGTKPHESANIDLNRCNMTKEEYLKFTGFKPNLWRRIRKMIGRNIYPL